MLHTSAQQVNLVYLVLTCGFALWRGAGAERIGAVATLLDWLLTPLFINHDWFSPQYGVLMVDLGYLAALVALALTSDRYWPMPAAALQLLEVLIQLAFIVNPTIWPWTVFYGDIACSWLVAAALAAGTWLEVVRPRQRRERAPIAEGLDALARSRR